MSMIPTIKLNSGNKMPVLGLGTWQMQGNRCKEAVKTAIEMGYTHIDTAWIYENQKEIGQALKEINANRTKLFITSKVWRTALSYDDLLAQCEETLKDLRTSYLDLYLVHWPNPEVPIKDTMRALKKLNDDGKVKNVGVSNFNIRLLKEALRNTRVPISVNQVEYHAHLNQENLLKFCMDNDIVVTAYSPLARGSLLKDQVISSIAKKHKKTNSQVALRWLLQKGLVVIPKASSGEHIKANMDIFNWSLGEEDMGKINSIGKKERLIDPGFADFDD